MEVCIPEPSVLFMPQLIRLRAEIRVLDPISLSP